MSTLFVSHSSDDNDTVKKIVDDLARLGHTVWVDHAQILAGDSIAGSIQRGIEEADAFLLLFSVGASRSPWVEIEWQAALSRSIAEDSFAFIPARLDDADVPLLLRGKKWTDFGTEYGVAIAAVRAALGPVKREASKKPTIWFYDDGDGWLLDFEQRHGEAFDIRLFDEVMPLLSALYDAAGAGEVPDIVLVDLYCPRQGIDPEILSDAEDHLARFFTAERELKAYVDDAWRPIGVEIVESVRQFYPASRLPVALHTQRGLVLLRDEYLRELELMGIGWLLKNRFSAETDRMILERIIMNCGHQIEDDKARVLIIDDNPAFLDAFRDRHDDYFEITTLESQADVLRMLRRLERDGRFPDIFLVDMYYPRGSDSDSVDRIATANRMLREFAQFEGQLQSRVEGAYEPVGMLAIRQIRQLLPKEELPVLVYTQSGLLMLADQGIQEIERLDAGWLLKDRYDARTEQAMIFGEILRSRRHRAR